MRKPDIPTILVCVVIVIGFFVVYHVTLGRKKT